MTEPQPARRFSTPPGSAGRRFGPAPTAQMRPKGFQSSLVLGLDDGTVFKYSPAGHFVSPDVLHEVCELLRGLPDIEAARTFVSRYDDARLITVVPARVLGGLRAALRAEGASEAQIKTCTVATLREMTGLGNTTSNSYAKAAGVKTPRRGQHNFRYSTADARAILSRIIEQTSEDTLRAKCRAALADLKEIAE